MPASTIQGSFGLDLGPLRKAAIEAQAMGKRLAATIRKDFESAEKSAGAAAGAIADKTASGFKYLGASVAASGAILAAGVAHAYNLGRELNELSDRTGIATGKLMILRTAFSDAGIEADQLGASINKMQKFIHAAANGAGAAADTLDTLGLSVATLQGMSPDEQFRAIGAAINGLEDPATRAAEAIAIFGRTGGKFLSLFGNSGALASAGNAIGRQAKLLDENSATFEAIAVRLGHAGIKLEGFFVGVAARLADTLLPLLDRFDKMDFSGVGERFGGALMKGAQFVIGVFKNPQAFIGVAVDAFVYGMMQAGNVLIATFKAARTYFQDGMLETIQGIGDVLLGTLLKAFQAPIAYLQAALEHTLNSLLGSLPEALGGTGAKAKAEKELRDEEHLDPAKFAAYAKSEAAKGNMDPTNAMQEVLRTHLTRMNQLRQAVADAGGPSMDQLLRQHNAQPVTVSTARGERNADQLLGQGTSELKYGLGRAAVGISRIAVEDVLGAGKYKTALMAGAAGLTASGASSLAAAAAPQPLVDPRTGKAPSAARIAQLQGQYGLRAANEMIYGPGIASSLPGAAPKALSTGRLAQLQSTYGVYAANKMLTTYGALPFPGAASPGQAGLGSIAASAARFTPFGAGSGILGQTGGLHAGGLGRSDSAWNIVHRGDHARALASAKKEQKEPTAIAKESVEAMAKAIGKELEVRD